MTVSAMTTQNCQNPRILQVGRDPQGPWNPAVSEWPLQGLNPELWCSPHTALTRGANCAVEVWVVFFVLVLESFSHAHLLLPCLSV